MYQNIRSVGYGIKVIHSNFINIVPPLQVSYFILQISVQASYPSQYVKGQIKY